MVVAELTQGGGVLTDPHQAVAHIVDEVQRKTVLGLEGLVAIGVVVVGGVVGGIGAVADRGDLVAVVVAEGLARNGRATGLLDRALTGTVVGRVVAVVERGVRIVGPGQAVVVVIGVSGDLDAAAVALLLDQAVANCQIKRSREPG